MNHEPFRIVTGPIRAGSTPVHIYNEGLTVLLYDKSIEPEMRRQEPKIIYYAGRESFEDPLTRSFLVSGKLLLFGLHGDGGVDLEILVGSPLTMDELQTGLWFPCQTGWLNLPSGNLCIHSYNSLPMGDNGEEPFDKGAEVIVPVGRYQALLYRKNWEEMNAAGRMNLEWAADAGIDVYGKGRIDDVLVLSPLEESEPSPDIDNILFRECME